MPPAFFIDSAQYVKKATVRLGMTSTMPSFLVNTTEYANMPKSARRTESQVMA